MNQQYTEEQRELHRQQSLILNAWRNEAIRKIKEAGYNNLTRNPKNKVLKRLLSLYNISLDDSNVNIVKQEPQRRIKSSLPPVASCKSNNNKPKPIGYKSRCRKDEAFDLNPEVFYKSWRWKELRLIALDTCGRRCVSCGAKPSANNSVVLHIDHIKPLRCHPELALDLSNLQVLCEDCNQGKSWFNTKDYRDDDQRERLSNTQLSSISVTEEMMSRLHEDSMQF